MYNAINYRNSKFQVLNERGAVVSDDLRVRLKDYLDNEDFLEELSVKLAGLEDGETTDSSVLQIDTKEWGFIGDDVLHIKADMSDPNSPKYEMYLTNAEFTFGDVDISLAAKILHQSTKDPVVGGVIGKVGNYIGSIFGQGDPGDDGTDEEKLIGVAAALASIAKDKHLDPKIYFDALDKEYKGKYGESLEDILETEFSGRAEAIALNVFRRTISSSTSRGVNLGSILLDIGLTIATFGGSTAAQASVKATSAATRLATKSKAIMNATRLGRGVVSFTKGVGGVISRLPGFSKLAKSVQATHLGKEIKVGMEVSYKDGKTMSAHKVLGISEAGVQLQHLKGTKAIFTTASSDFLLSVSPGLANKVLTAAKITPTKAGMLLATKKAAEVGNNLGAETSAAGATGWGTFTEVMGWYDTLAADPQAYIDSVKLQGEAELAEAIYDLKEGTGFWGNTTNQEELAMALIITSMTSEAAVRVKEEYTKLDGGSVSAVLADELGGDMGDFASVWWNVISGGKLSTNTAAIKTRINQKP
jgi:hypothetical protein